MLLADLVATSAAVGATRSRRAKTAAIAALLSGAEGEELALAAQLLTGRPRQGKVDVGYRRLAAVDVAPADAPLLRLCDVDAVLDALVGLSGAGSQAERLRVLTELLDVATADERAFLRGLLLGELRQGALEGIVVQGVAEAFVVPVEAVRRAQMLRADLGVVARAAAEGGADALAAIRMTLFSPVQPMLATTAATAGEVVAELGACAVEAKLDGARVQVHRDGDAVRVYSRSLRDMTEDVPGVVAAARALPATRLILDGEVLGVGADGRPVPFQDTMKGLAGGLPFFFDCLLRDDADLLEVSLRERRAVLEDLVPAEQRVRRWLVTDPEESEAANAEVLAAGHEGVVVKDLESPYEAGRRGGAWRKVKPVRTLDLVVLAAEWGSGRRKGWLSNLWLGARDPAAGPDDPPFLMLGKTFKGLSDEVLGWQTDALLARATARDGHAVHVRPELVVEIAIDGVVRSPRYPGGVALRFARVVRYRDDKAPEQADVIGHVQALLPGAVAP